MIRIVIIGAGIAGASAAESALSAASDSSVTLINEEPVLPYYRLNLTRLLGGEIARDSIFLHSADWYLRKNIALLEGRRVVSLATGERVVRMDDDSSIEYDRLIIATGARACMPDLPGIGLSGITTVRTLADTDAIIGALERAPSCVILGAGTLGIETAGALSARGMKVTLLERHEWLMSRHLSKTAGELLEAHLTEKGVKVEKNASIREFRGDGSVNEVALSDGRVVPAGLVVAATGVVPDLALADGAGIATNSGIVVDDTMQTSVPGILAAGDVAEHDGTMYGTWAPAKQQGSVAGLAATDAAARFAGVSRSNSMKILGMTIFSIGKVHPEGEDDEVLEERDGNGLYQFVFRQGKMRGCILMGNTRSTGAAKKAIEIGTDFSRILAGKPTASGVLKALK